MYAGLLQIPLKRLFSVTNWLIVLLAAGMASQCVGFLLSAGLVPSWGDTIWDTSWLLKDSSLVGKALHALIGYTARPAGIQIVAYLATLATIVGWHGSSAGRRRQCGRHGLQPELFGVDEERASMTPLFMCGVRPALAQRWLSIQARIRAASRASSSVSNTEHARRLDQLVVLRDRAARREALGLRDLVLLQDRVAPDLVAVVGLRFHYRVTSAARPCVPTCSTLPSGVY